MNDEKIWLSEWGGRGSFSHGRSNSKGVAILFSRGLDISITNTIKDTEGRFLILQATQGQDKITLVNIYAPTSNEVNNQTILLGKIHDILTNLEVHNLFIAGDLNVKMDDQTSNPTPARDTYIAQINTLMDDYSLIDVWKSKNPASKRGTFHRNTYSARLDYLFAPEYLLPSISAVQILTEPSSDHCIVSMAVGIPSSVRGPGYWRFENYLLKDKTFLKEMMIHLRQVLLEDFDDPNVQWEWTKFKIREFCISYTTTRRREEKALLLGLERRLKLLADKHDMSDSPDIATESQSLKRQISEINHEKANRAIFKSKANWIKLGERPTSYFLGLEKRQSKEKTITSMRDESGRILTNNMDILSYEKRYFSNIYEEDPSTLPPIQDIPLTMEDVPQVTEGHQQIMGLPFSHRDFHTALKNLNKNKSPGSDGITPEFYLQFWDQLHNLFYESIMFSLDQGHLTPEQRTGVVTLIPKKAQDCLQLQLETNNLA